MGPRDRHSNRAAQTARRRRAIVIVLLVLGFAPFRLARGDEEAAQPATTAKARAYLATVQKDGAAPALERLYAQDVDPWVVAEELLLTGNAPAALELAAVRLSSDQQALRAYVERTPRPDPSLAQRILAAAAAIEASEPAHALELLGAAQGENLTVTATRALAVRAAALDALQRTDEAREVLERLAERAAVIGWRRAAMDALIRLLERLDAERKPSATRRVLSTLLSLDADARDLARSAAWCAQLGQLEHARGALRTSLRWLLEAEGLYDVLARGPGLAPAVARERFTALRTLAHVQLELGNTAAGVDAAFRAHDISQHMDTLARIDALNQLADVYQALGRLEEAERNLQAAVALYEGRPAVIRARVDGDLARLYVEQGRFKEARALYDEVHAVFDASSDPWGGFIVRLHKAALGLDEGRAGRDVEALQRALRDLLRIQRDLEDLPSTALPREELEINAKLLAARALNLLGRHAEALSLLRELAETNYVRDVPSLLQYAQRELSHALRRADRRQEAYDVSLHAVEALGTEVAGLSSSFALSALSAPSVRDLVEEHLACALALGNPALLVAALERTRGMAFLSELRRRQRAGAGPSRGAGLSRVGALADEVAGAARAYWEVLPRRQLKDTTRARDELWALRRKLRAAQDREELEAARAVPDVSGAPGGPVFRPPPALEPGEAMLYYAATDADWIAVVVRGATQRTIVLGARDALEARLSTLRDTWLSEDRADHAAALTNLIDMLVPVPLRELLSKGRDAEVPAVGHVYVAAGDVLAQVPWPVVLGAALERAGGKAADVPTVSLVASQEVLRRLRLWNRAAGKGPLLALGDPDYTIGDKERTRVAIFGRKLQRLEESGIEVAAIAQEARGDLILRGGDANEATLMHCLFDAPYPFDVLHLSCHGILYGAKPWLSALALHPTPGKDGLLTVDDVTKWRMPHGPRLVVLAACESGLGVPVAGEGEEGLVRAFLLAGARHVVASFWKVPDRTSRDIMIAFHKHRRAGGLSPAAALRKAQAEVRAAAGGKLVPHQWAGWAVWGPRD